MKSATNNQKIIRHIVVDAMFLALITIFTLVPNIGYIPLGPVSIQFISVFVLIGAACFGWKRGLLYGFFFGLSSLIKVLTIPAGWFDALFLYPWNSVLPRIIFGLVAGLVFDWIRKHTNKDEFIICCIPAGIILTLFHSFIVLTLIYCFNVDAILTNMGLVGTSVTAGYVIIVLGSFVGLQIILEAVVGGAFTPLIMTIILRNNLVEFKGKEEKKSIKQQKANEFRNIFIEELSKGEELCKK